MTQMTIDELETRTDEAVKRAATHANQRWMGEAEAAVEVLIKKGESFTTDEVWRLLSHFNVETHEPRAMGAIIRKFVKEGRLEHVGYQKTLRPESHRRPVSVWRPR
jgi:hypothetical protein